MSSGPKQPTTRPPPKDADDAWARIQRETRAAILGVDPDVEELGDTVATMAKASLAESEEAPSNEILDLVNASLKAEPERVDLWMMRFEVQKTLGLKSEFAKALVAGWANPRVGRSLDWVQIGEMWKVLAPGEPIPDGIKLPTAVEPAQDAAPATAPAAAGDLKRRFSDTALTIAASELSSLGKVYATLRAQPDFFDRMSQRIGPMIRRPTPLFLAEKTSRNWGASARIFFKREDQRKVTPEAEYALSQAWIGSRLGRSRLITGNDVEAYSMGLAIAAKQFAQKCTVAVRPGELEENKAFVSRLRALGAEVVTAPNPARADDDPRVTALELWLQSKGTAYLALSMGWGPGPYPTMVNDFQSLLGREVLVQLRDTPSPTDPLTLVASVGSEADAIGFVLPQLNNPDVELVFAEPEPGGIASWRTSQRLKVYNGARREHCWLHATNRITHVAVADSQALAMQQQASSLEGIQLSFEDARSLALTSLLVRRSNMPRNYVVLAA